MRIIFLAVLMGLGSLVFASSEATAQTSIADACGSLDRPNIDCACVAKRVAVFDRISPDEASKTLIHQGYLNELGLDNSFKETFAEIMQDPMKAIVVTEAYDVVGGRPENITEYEDGCVIAGAPKPDISLAYTTTSVDQYVASCTASTGDQRYCTCSANRKTARLSEREFEAYFRSFSDYDGDTNGSLAEENKARGDAMGISASEFDALQNRARGKLSPHEEVDESTCSALLWADQSPGFDDETRILAGFDPGVSDQLAPAAVSAAPTSSDAVTRARQIVSTSCASNGNSSQYCTCYASQFETRVVGRAASPKATLAWALMNHGDALKTSEFASLTQSIPQADHQAAGMLLIETMDMGEGCSQGPAPAATRLKGTPKERMMKVCVAENEDKALCSCLVGEMESGLSEDDFELIVDMREAEYRGSEDPLAEVAAERGLTRAEAEEALGSNRAMLSGLMGMNAMKCLGGMPNMQGIPGFPGQ